MKWLYWCYAGIIILSTPVTVSAEAGLPAPIWSRRFGGSGHGCYGLSVAAGHDGTAVLTGYFSGDADFGSGQVSSRGRNDMFLARFDPSGACLWSRSFGDRDTDDIGQCVALDQTGTVILAGRSPGTVDLGGGPLTSAGDFDIYLAKFDANGTHIWSKRFGDASSQYPYSVATDGQGNVVMTGMFEGNVDFGVGLLSSEGETDAFLVKFNSTGACLWSQSFGDSLHQNGYSVAISDEGDIYLAGHFNGTVNLGGGPLITSGGALFVAKFDGYGVHQWSKAFGNNSSGELAADGMGGIILSGSYGGTIDFGGEVLSSAGGLDVFVAKFDADGNHIWSRGFGNLNDQYGGPVSADSEGNAVISGLFAGAIDFGSGALPSAGDYDIFVAGFNATGSTRWSVSFGDQESQAARSVAFTDAGNFVLTGDFYGTVDFGGGPLTSAGYADGFLAMFAGFAPTGAGGGSIPRPILSAQPNPFSSASLIRFTLSKGENVRLSVYDAKGKLVRVLVSGTRGPGAYEVTWDGLARHGTRLGSGVYFCRLTAGSLVESQKLVLLR